MPMVVKRALGEQKEREKAAVRNQSIYNRMKKEAKRLSGEMKEKKSVSLPVTKRHPASAVFYCSTRCVTKEAHADKGSRG
ncbi:hypothetical protein BaRGS_00032345 [Batillaria attramentaria]|uniref:Uncharacterized protein n=1 Tax=Batillaria attramentaria TaxID=370345 RepID=A0ABD0JN13_9CAEN